MNSVVRAGAAVSLALCVLCISGPVGHAHGSTPAFVTAVAKVRLVAQQVMTGGSYRSGIVIVMPSGSHTYWERPGDAGVPPVFAFNGSTNITKSQVLFPVPSRITEDGLDAFGYKDQVVFPVEVTPQDAAKPSKLHLDMTYAVCNKICIPGRATADITLPVKTSEDDPAIAAAWSALPRPLLRPADLSVTPIEGASKPSWTLAWRGSEPVEDIFAAAPEGYAFDTKRGPAPGTWTLIASDIFAGPQNNVTVTMTLKVKGGGYTARQVLALPRQQHSSP